jgi:hypothetical protein
MADTVTPGPVFTWTELIDYGEVVLFTPDFRDEVVSLDATFFGVVDIQVAGTVWVLDSDGVISRFQRNGEHLSDEDFGGTRVSAIALDPYTRSSWVALESENHLIYHFQEDGTFISSKAIDMPVTSMAVDRISRDLWIGSSDPLVAKLTAATGTNTLTPFNNFGFIEPTLVATSGGAVGVWIADRGSNKVYSTTTAGINWEQSGFSSVNDIAVDGEGNYCAVADPEADQVAIFDARSGSLIEKVNNLGNPYYVTFNNESSDILISGSSGLITTVDTTGRILRQVQNPDRTGKMALAY